MKVLRGANIARFGSMAMIAFLMMGNQSCDSQEKQQARFLKKTVELRNITAHNILLPGGGTFDFESVANWQMVDELNKNDHFVIPVNDPSTTMYSAPDMPRTISKPIATKPDVAADHDVPACLKNKAQVVMAGQINSFEMAGGGGICIGFSTGGGQCGIIGIGASIFVQTAKLDMGLHAWSPYYNNYLIGSGAATSTQTETQIKASINFSGLQISPELYFKTRLADVTRTGIDKSLDALVADIDNRAIRERRPIWEGQVAVSTENDNFVKINAGRMHYLRVGDEFEIYNVRTVWDGSVCASNFTRELTTTKPVAIVKIKEEGDLDVTYAFAEITEGTGDRIYPGAVVRIRKLVEDAGQAQPKSQSKATIQKVTQR